MFSKESKSESSNKEQNRISAGTLLKGEIEAKGCFRIEGTLQGTLKTTGKVVISKGGLIEGNLICQNADFEGRFSGKLIVSEILTLRDSAVVEGEVIAGKLAIEPGAAFNATCEMKGAVKSINDAQKKKERTA